MGVCLASKKKNEEDVKEFLRQYKEPPLCRLDIQAAVRGGINEVFRCLWIEEDEGINQSERFYCTDMNSSYPFHASRDLPVGEYKVGPDIKSLPLASIIFSFLFQIVTDALKDIYFDIAANKFFLSRPNEEKPLEIFGLLYVRVLPPKKELYPILMYRSHVSKRTSLPLCKLCADEHFHGKCHHDEWGRSWAAVYTSEELAYAVSKGYHVLAYFEAYTFKKKGRPFETYIKTLAYLKIRVRFFDV